MLSQIRTILTRDPAARNVWEIIICYPSFHVMVIYRFAHFLWGLRFRFIARVFSQMARLFTGIEIHPAAVIGKNFFIDHGMGVVIGETACIEDDVTLYHAVTLGGVSPAIDSDKQRNVKRHPTIRSGTIIGAGAQILGDVTIGRNVRIGSAAIITRDIPDNVTVVGNPGRIVKKKCDEKFSAYGIPDGKVPDVVTTALEEMQQHIAELKAEIEHLKGTKSPRKTSSSQKKQLHSKKSN